MSEHICKVCGGSDFKDISPTQNNGVFGRGYSSWKLTELLACKKCGTVISPSAIETNPHSLPREKQKGG